MLNVKLTHSAERDLLDIAAYTERKWGTKQRISYMEGFDRCFYLIAEMPDIGISRHSIRPNYYSLRQGKHVVFYTFNSEELYIVAVLHERMDYERHL